MGYNVLLFSIRFFKRLVHFYKPTNHRFSRLEIDHKLVQKIAHSGCLLVDFLLSTEQVSLISDAAQCLYKYINNIHGLLDFDVQDCKVLSQTDRDFNVRFM